MARHETASLQIVVTRYGLPFLVVVGCNLPPVEGPGIGWATDGYEQFFVGEQTLYSSPIGTCPMATPLTPLANSFRNAMVAKGWFGILGEDPNDICTMPGHRCAEPADFVEQQEAQQDGLVGQDSLWGDAATLSVFSGHGAHNALAFRRPSTTPGGAEVCRVFLNTRVRLGSYGGGRARVAVFAASCLGYAADLLEADGADDFRDTLGRSNSWHHLAFYDSPTMDLMMLPEFVALLDQGESTNESWIDATEFNPPMDYNQPIVYTTYNAVADAGQPLDYLGTRHELSNLLTGAELPPTAPRCTPPSCTHTRWTTVIRTTMIRSQATAWTISPAIEMPKLRFGESNMTHKTAPWCAPLAATLFLLLGAGSNTSSAPLGDEGEDHESKFGATQAPQTVEVGTQLTSVTISRIRRTSTDLSTRAATLASAITGTTMTG